jgi:hypothetical protein
MSLGTGGCLAGAASRRRYSASFACWPPRAVVPVGQPEVLRQPAQSSRAGLTGWTTRRPATAGHGLFSPCGDLRDFIRGGGTELRRGGKGSRWRVRMPGMKITLSAAMRARDVSRPRPEHEAAAELSNAGSTSARSGSPHPEPSPAAPPRAPEASLPARPAAPRAAAPSPAASQTTAAPATPSPATPAGRTPAPPAAAPPAAATGKAKSPGTPKAPGQNGDAGRGRSGGRGKRHRPRKRGGR